MPLLRLLHQITNMYQNVKDAQNELREQPGNLGKRVAPLKDESSLASEMNDPTIIGSMHEPMESSLLDERYDTFNEAYQLGHSVSRTRMPSLGPLIPLTPSPSSRNRPQSFAQKLKSTSKSVKGKLGYTNLTETLSSPVKKSPTSSFDHAVLLQKSVSEHKSSFLGGGSVAISGFADSIQHTSLSPALAGANMPVCWKTMLHLLDLYATMPETKTVKQRISISPDATEKSAKKLNTSHDSKHLQEEEEGVGTPVPPRHELGVAPERTRLVVFGVAKIHKTRLLATLSGLKLEAEITSLHSSATWRKKSRPAALECSHTGQVGRAMIVLLEGVAPNQQ